jgi:hypothetical protein
MKNLANCKPSEFLSQTNKIRKSVEKWLKLTDIINIRKRIPVGMPEITADLSSDELEAVNIMRKGLNGKRAEESAERVIDLFYKTKNNSEFVNRILKDRYI